jgi:TolB-like protein
MIVVAAIVGAVFFANRPPPAPAGGKFRIAVLPFENLSPDPANAFFADGMHEEILRSLANARTLDVVSRTTMMLYRRQPKTIPELFDDLGVTHVLEGTVRRDALDVRVTLQLVDARADKQVWAGSFDRKLVDVMTLQSEIAAEVAAQLATRLTDQGAPLASPASLAAYDHWLQGVLAWQNLGAGFATLQEIRRVEGLYTKAIELDPGYAMAYADRCRVRASAFVGGLDMTDENIAGARADLAIAQRLAGDTPHVLVRSAIVAYFLDGDMTRALELFAAAEKAGPLDADHIMTKANFLGFAGRVEEAVAAHAEAARLDPANPAIARFRMVHLFAAHRPADALRVLRELDARIPGRVERGEWLFAYTGTTQRWRTELERMRDQPQPNFVLANEFDLLRYEGRHEELRAMLDRTPLVEYRPQSPLRSLVGSGMKPVAALRGWERLLAGDRPGAKRAGESVLELHRQQTVKNWNKWSLHLTAAEGALFTGDERRAMNEARAALASLGAAPNLATNTYTRMLAARIFAWAGAHEEAIGMLERLSGEYPGLGPAHIARDPLLSRPLADEPRWRALTRALEAQIAANQSLL